MRPTIVTGCDHRPTAPGLDQTPCPGLHGYREPVHLPTEHAAAADLEDGLNWVREAPADQGELKMIVCRPSVDERQVLPEGRLDLREGLAGDSWHVRPNPSTADGGPDPDGQLTLMNWRLALMVARNAERVPLAGDQLYVDFDLSLENCPAGSLLAIGTTTVELTEKPHLGCSKFVGRFGKDALRLVNSPLGRRLRLRGANARVVVPGSVRPGNAVQKLD
jgi:MOSC domain-containing protein YiiM